MARRARSRALRRRSGSGAGAGRGAGRPPAAGRSNRGRWRDRWRARPRAAPPRTTGVGAGGEEEHDLPALAAPLSTSSWTRRATLRASARRQCTPVPAYAALSVTSSSTACRRPGREVAGRRQRLELLAELGAEVVVDDRQHLGPRAVVARQRQQRLRTRPPLAEHLHVGVPEAVDRLELVADEEALRVGSGQQVDELALEPVRVLELVDHDRAEAQLLALAQRLAACRRSRARSCVLVERRLAVFRRRVMRREAVEEPGSSLRPAAPARRAPPVRPPCAPPRSSPPARRAPAAR